MKIIKQGRKQNGWAKEFNCTGNGNGGGGCGALLLVEFNDIYKTYRHCRDETDTFFTFKCSACGVETDIKDYDGPRDNIPDKNKVKCTCDGKGSFCIIHYKGTSNL